MIILFIKTKLKELQKLPGRNYSKTNNPIAARLDIVPEIKFTPSLLRNLNPE